MRELDRMAQQAATDRQTMNQLIEQSQGFILKCASVTVRRYITTSDDEWSLALMAFTQAVETYDGTKGSFTAFAELVIRRRLIDYCRTQSKYKSEIAVDPHVFDTDTDENDEEAYIKAAVAEQVSKRQDDSMRYEIEAANGVFARYGFSFFDLADCSPKAEKTKSACAKAVAYLLKNKILMEELARTKQLPIKPIEKNVDIPRKIIERHRKYIIAAVEILSGEYPCLAEYMRFIRKELDK